METKSGRSSKLSDRSTSSSRLSGSDVDLIQKRLDALHADTRNWLEAGRTAIGVVCAQQVETRGVLGTVRHRLERLENSPASKFVAGLDLNPSLSNEVTAAPNHSTIILEANVSTAPVVPRRSERLVDYRQVAFLPRWTTSTAVSSNSCPVSTLYPSSSFAALQQHANPAAFETVPATPVERGRNVTVTAYIRIEDK